MEVITGVAEMSGVRRSWGLDTVGFVPTMGYLHQGHLSLVERSIGENKRTVVSIFVNPTQFGPSEDFNRYPRDMERDLSLLAPLGVDTVFAPSPEGMYPQGMTTSVRVSGVSGMLEGSFRPGHFDGVATVVAKLFGIVSPTAGYFGMKDIQQLAVITRMTHDLNIPVEVIGCPTIREPDGLAMSSRNTYLDVEERQRALGISRGLAKALAQWEAGNRSPKSLCQTVREELVVSGIDSIDYVEFVDTGAFQPLSGAEAIAAGPIGVHAIAVAARVGRTRLIDNTLLP